MIKLSAINSKHDIGFILIKFGDLGPEPVFCESLPFDKDVEEIFGVQLGIYLSLMINKGTNKADLRLGLNGPYPWSQTPEHNILAFTFLGRDPNILDTRAKEHGVFMVLAMFYESDNQELVRAKISVENTLSEFLLSKEKLEDLVSVEVEDIPILIAQVKAKLFNSVKEGDRIIQENAMEVILSNKRVKYLGLYHAENKTLIAPIIGEEEDFQTVLMEGKALNFEIFFTTFGPFRFGLMKLSKYNKIAIIVLSNEDKDTIFMEKEFLELYQALYTAVPLLEEYYGI